MKKTASPESGAPTALLSRIPLDEAAAILGVSMRKFYEDVRANRIPHIRLQRRIVIPRAAFMRWLDSCGKNVSVGA